MKEKLIEEFTYWIYWISKYAKNSQLAKDIDLKEELYNKKYEGIKFLFDNGFGAVSSYYNRDNKKHINKIVYCNKHSELLSYSKQFKYITEEEFINRNRNELCKCKYCQKQYDKTYYDLYYFEINGQGYHIPYKHGVSIFGDIKNYPEVKNHYTNKSGAFKFGSSLNFQELNEYPLDIVLENYETCLKKLKAALVQAA